MQLNIILMGPPGCGKGTQSHLLLEQYHQFKYLSMGDLLRAKFSLNDSRLTSGQLFDHDITNIVLEEFLKENGTTNILMDGFPRDILQVTKMIELGVICDLIIIIDLPAEVIMERITGRLIHASSGRTYHKTLYPPKLAGLDDITQEPLVNRPEDNITVVKERINIYQARIDSILALMIGEDSLNYKTYGKETEVYIVNAENKDKLSIFEDIKSKIDILKGDHELLLSLAVKVVDIAKSYLKRDSFEYYDLKMLSLQEMLDLNISTRGVESSTNVLSFPSQLPEEYRNGHVGDIAVCPEFIRKEAQSNSIDLEHHWAHIILHGYIHLLGYDHEDDQEAELMEQLEVKILSLAQIPNPYVVPAL
jgi:adenylate kinase